MSIELAFQLVTVRLQWRLHLLTDASVSGQHIGVLRNGKSRGAVIRDLEHAPPLGKVTTIFFILGAALRQPIKTCGGAAWITMVTLPFRNPSNKSENAPCVVVSPSVPLRPAVPLST